MTDFTGYDKAFGDIDAFAIVDFYDRKRVGTITFKFYKDSTFCGVILLDGFAVATVELNSFDITFNQIVEATARALISDAKDRDEEKTEITQRIKAALISYDKSSVNTNDWRERLLKAGYETFQAL